MRRLEEEAKKADQLMEVGLVDGFLFVVFCFELFSCFVFFLCLCLLFFCWGFFSRFPFTIVIIKMHCSHFFSNLFAVGEGFAAQC